MVVPTAHVIAYHSSLMIAHINTYHILVRSCIADVLLGCFSTQSGRCRSRAIPKKFLQKNASPWVVWLVDEWIYQNMHHNDIGLTVTHAGCKPRGASCPPSPRCMADIRGVRGSNPLRRSCPKYQQCAKGPLVEHQQHPCNKCQEQPNHRSNALEASMEMVSFRWDS